jgi:transposase
VSPTQAHESLYVEPVLNAVRIPRRTGRPRQRPERIAGDKGYSHPRIRRWLRAHHIGAVIPERRDQIAHRHGRPPAFDRGRYRQRNVIECCVGWLKEARRIATRYEKLAVHFLGVLKLGMIRKHLQLALSNTP